MREVLRWIDRHDGGPGPRDPRWARRGGAPATDLLSGIVATDPREQSGIWSTASGVLAAYRTEGAMASTSTPPLDLDAFCVGAEHALRVLDRAPAAPIRPAGGRQSSATCEMPPTPDRATDDARPTHAAGPRRGRQHRSHPRPAGNGERGRRARAAGPGLPAGSVPGPGPLGQAADGFLSLFGTTVVLRGIADTATLRDLSALAGEREVTRRRSAARSATGAASARPRPSARHASLGCRSMPSPRALPGAPSSLGPDKVISEVALTPAHERSPWRDLVPRGADAGPVDLSLGR